MSSQREPRRFAKGKLETRGRKPRKFDGMEERQFSKKPWPPGKPPGGKLPPGPTAQDKSASPPDKPAK